MARAVCKSCGTFFVWKAGKGAKLVYLKCTKCGGKLRSMKRKEEGEIRNKDMIDLRGI